jgi:two-component system, NtrC family, response regulator AtoC
MTRASVLIVDDAEDLVASLIYGFKAHGIDAEGARDAAEGLLRLQQRLPDMAIIDLRLPDVESLEFLTTIKKRYPKLPVAMISAHGDIRVAVEAVKLGALDFVAKPFELEDIVGLIHKAMDLSAKPAAPRKRQTVEIEDDLMGDSPAMTALRDEIEVVARSSARIILLLGPSGTGKGLVARMLHQMSARAGGPLVVVNCASLPEQLLEAELFGAERGAYTGAHQKRVGLV